MEINYICHICILYIIAALFHISTVMAQDADQTSFQTMNVPAHSPEAAALGMFGEIPIGLHTGIPQIQIPFHEIVLKDLKIPVALNYHSAGVKVDQLAESTGLGWSLEAGGILNVITHGLSDFLSTGWLNTTLKTPQDREIKSVFDPFVDPDYINDPDYKLNDFSTKYLADTQPDVFYFSFPGKSGRFFFDQNGTVLTSPFEDIKVSYEASSNGKPISFRIIDNKGNIFDFAVREEVSTVVTSQCNTSINEYPEPEASAFSFYLSRIQTARGEEVDFNYQSINYDYENQISGTRYSQKAGSGCGMLVDCLRSSASEVAGVRLSSIETSSGEQVHFLYSQQDRVDLPGTNALESILVMNNADTVKRYDLTYDYFTSNSNPGTNPDNYRLRLLQVQQSGQQPYLFTYNTQQLPHRLSFAQDHWGYFNGSNNTVLFPRSLSIGFTSGADREASFPDMAAGIIESITYPTGGSTSFTFEPNDLYTERTEYNETTTTVQVGAAVNQTRTRQFTLPSGFMNIRARWVTDVPEGQIGGTTSISISGPGVNKIFTGSQTSAVSLSNLSFVAGEEYTITVSCYGATETHSYITILWEIGETEVIKENKIVGGLRIKSITNHPLSGNDITRFFEYREASDSTKSSGVSMFQPAYEYIHYVANGVGGLCEYYAQGTSSTNDLGTVEGGNIVYTEVSEHVGDKHNGYTAYQFYVSGQSPSAIAFPFPPKITLHWLNGLPLSIIKYRYDHEENIYTPVRKEVKHFKTELGNGPNEHVVQGAKIALESPKIGNGAPSFAIGYYQLFASWCYLQQQEITEYKDDGTSITLIENFYYDNPEHTQVTRIEKLRSDQDTMKVVFAYIPEQFTLEGNGVYGDMRDLNMLNYITQKDIYLNGVFLEREKTVYNKFNQETYEPIEMYKTKGSDAPERYMKFFNYDLKSNPLAVSLYGGINKAYQWGYQGRYLTAEVKNVSEGAFFYEDFEEIESQGLPHTGKSYHEGDYQITWVVPNSRHYVVSYWYRDGNTWKYSSPQPYTGPMNLTQGDAYDDIRIHPDDAEMTTYTYEPLIGMTSETDASGHTLFYKYDSAGRLSAILDQDGFIIETYCYNYAGQQVDCDAQYDSDN